MALARQNGAKEVAVNVYIDNSNLWIQGQKTYARKRGMRVLQDPTWRFDVGRLLDVLAGQSGLPTEERQHNFQYFLFGSTPPPVDSVWVAMEACNVHVSTFPRSKWTGREKQVDQKIASKSVSHASNAYHSGNPCEVIIVSGDSDMIAAVETIREEYGLSVDIWSWKDGLAHEYLQLQKKDQDIKVHLLDDYLDHIGFCHTEFRVDRNVIDPHSIVVLDPMPKATEVEEVLSDLPIPVYLYNCATRRPNASSKDLVLIPVSAKVMTYKQLEDFFFAAKKRFEPYGLGIMAYLEYCNVHFQGSETSTRLEISNRFSELPGIEDQTVGGKDDDIAEVEEDSKDDEFVRVNRRSDQQRDQLRKTEKRSRERCFFRMYCSHGVNCPRYHTKEEENRFRKSGPKKATKYQYCRWDGNCYRPGCEYAHDETELFCPTCDKHGAGHEMKYCPERVQNTR